MKKTIHIIGLAFTIIIAVSCAKPANDVIFPDQVKASIYDFLVANKTKFSSFLKIVDEGGLADILNAYNSGRNTTGYTLFLPDNNAIDQYIQESGYASFDAFLADTALVRTFGRYHVLSKKYLTDDFPFGAFDKLNLTNDQLTVSFVSKVDTAYFEINNMAPVVQTNIKLANGYIDVISKVLKPLTYTTYDWLQQHQGYSIFKAAVDLTGFKDLLSINKKQPNTTAITILVEADSIFNKKNIYSINDLIAYINPANSNYTDPLNRLYNFVGYHIITGGYFLNTFEAAKNYTNYNTYSDIPIAIDSRYLELMINTTQDTVTVDTIQIIKKSFVGINYDISNIVTLSGVMHFVNKVMGQKAPSPTTQNYEFYDDLYLDSLSSVGGAGTYLIDDSTRLRKIKYTGADLSFVTGVSGVNSLSNGDYLSITGSFTISYTIPKIIQGAYDVNLSANRGDPRNAVIQLYVDGIEIGRQQDLTVIPTNFNSWGINTNYPLGTVKFLKYESHTVTIKSTVPGRLLWDYINFTPNTKIQ